MKTPTTAAARKLQIAPVPAWAITPGAMMNTEDAGVIADRVISRAPSTRRPRRRAGAEAGLIGCTVSLMLHTSDPLGGFFETVSKNVTSPTSRPIWFFEDLSTQSGHGTAQEAGGPPHAAHRRCAAGGGGTRVDGPAARRRGGEGRHVPRLGALLLPDAGRAAPGGAAGGHRAVLRGPRGGRPRRAGRPAPAADDDQERASGERR